MLSSFYSHAHPPQGSPKEKKRTFSSQVFKVTHVKITLNVFVKLLKKMLFMWLGEMLLKIYCYTTRWIWSSLHRALDL